jgi:hypothetical protein
MLTMIRNVRLWTLGLCVLTIASAAAFAARAAGRVLSSQDIVSIKVVNQPDMDTPPANRTKARDVTKISKALEGFQCDIAGTVLGCF